MATISLTYALPLRVDDRQGRLIADTCLAYVDACNRVSQWCRANKTLKQRAIHDANYRILRDECKLPSQMAVSVTRRVIGNYRTIKETQGSPWNTKQAPRYKNAGYDLVYNRDYTIRADGTLSLNTLKGRIKIHADWSHIPPERRKGVYGTARILNRRGTWTILIPITLWVEDPATPRNIMGVDLGLRFLAVSYDSHGHATFYPGKEVTQKRAQYKQLRTSLQKRGTRSARRRLRSIGNRENRWMSDVNHQTAKALIAQCDQPTLIVLEDLTGIRSVTERVRKSQRYVQVSWAFFQLRTMIEYKAKLAGHTVMHVNPAYTSQACPICGQIRKANRKRKTHEYVCANCGYRSNDDRVAAMNIRQRGYNTLLESEAGMPAPEGRSQPSPDVPPPDCKGIKGRRPTRKGKPTIATAGQGQASPVRER